MMLLLQVNSYMIQSEEKLQFEFYRRFDVKSESLFIYHSTIL